MYWRPGCPFCANLQAGLLDAGVDFTGINIWEDPDAAAVVRAANNGNELVPTVVVGDKTLSNPSVEQVVEALGALN